MWALAGGGALVIVMIAAFATSTASGGPEQSTRNERVAAAGDPGASANAIEAPATPDNTGSGSRVVPTPAVKSGGASPSAARLPVPAPAETGIEVRPLANEPPAQPPSESLPNLLENTAPTQAAANGRLVAGLPAVMSPAPRSTVAASAVNVNGETVTTTLSAGTAATAGDILTHYEKAFSALGLTGTPATLSAGDTIQTFYRGNDSVTLTIGTAADGTTPYTLRGLFSTVS